MMANIDLDRLLEADIYASVDCSMVHPFDLENSPNKDSCIVYMDHVGFEMVNKHKKMEVLLLDKCVNHAKIT